MGERKPYSPYAVNRTEQGAGEFEGYYVLMPVHYLSHSRFSMNVDHHRDHDGASRFRR